MKFLWQDCVIVTDPPALAAIMGRGAGAMDKAHVAYAPINKMCDPHGNANLLTSAADDSWKAIRKAVAVSFSVQVCRIAEFSNRGRPWQKLREAMTMTKCQKDSADIVCMDTQ